MQRRTYSGEEGWLLSYADLITNLLILFAVLLGASELSRARMQQIAERISGVEQPASLSSIQDEIDARIEQEGLQELIGTELTDDGLKLSLNSGLMFASGSAQIRVEQEGVLDRMLAMLVPYASRYDFAIEGHTDTEPVSPGSYYKSNWELSADRANAVRARLEQVGVVEGGPLHVRAGGRARIRVEGYADTVALPEEALAGLPPAERLARHRRVIVRVY